MAESFVQVPPDSTGKQIDAYAVISPTGNLSYRQTIVIGDPGTAGNALGVDEHSRIKVKPQDFGALDMMMEDLQQATGNGPGLLIGPDTPIDPQNPVGLAIQTVLRDPVQLDPAYPTVIGGVPPSGVPARIAIGPDNRVQLSDAPPTQEYSLSSTGILFMLDTTGYNSLSISLIGTWVGTVTFTGSNDGSTWNNAPAYQVGAPVNGFTTAPTANGTYVLPTMNRFIRATVTTYTSGTIIAVPYLRTGTAQQTIAIGGIGGNIAPGSAATANPLPTGATDSGGITRRIQSDVNGNLQHVGVLPPGYQLNSYSVTYGKYSQIVNSSTPAQSAIAPALVGGVDGSQAARPFLTDSVGALLVGSEGSTAANQSIQELLTQILGVLRVQSQYLFEIRNASMGTASDKDEPDLLLNDMMSNPVGFSNMN
jgi:hypothetical protein